MTPRRRLSTLPLTPYGASVTSLNEGIFGDGRNATGRAALPTPGEVAQAVQSGSAKRAMQRPTTIVRTMMVNLILATGVPQILLNANPRRVGMQIQFIDPNVDGAGTGLPQVAPLFYQVGVVAAATSGFQLTTGSFALYDFTTPTDIVWGLWNINPLASAPTAQTSQVIIAEFTRVGPNDPAPDYNGGGFTGGPGMTGGGFATVNASDAFRR